MKNRLVFTASEGEILTVVGFVAGILLSLMIALIRNSQEMRVLLSIPLLVSSLWLGWLVWRAVRSKR